MDLEELFRKADATMWQDFKGFLRITQCYSEEGEQLPVHILMLIFIVSFGALLSPEPVVGGLMSLALCFIFYGKIFYLIIQEYKIKRDVLDIEMNSNNTCMVRTKDHKYGIIGIKRDKKNKVCELRILLPLKYNMIKRISPTVFIISSEKGKGLYNSEDKKIVVIPQFEDFKIVNDDPFIFESIDNGIVCKFNEHGERIVMY